jgi:hypothetical protein
MENTHTYTTQVTETLPEGRWLKAGDVVQEGDLVCYSDEKARVTVGWRDCDVQQLIDGNLKFYRPAH